jgi:hypothetical protein
MSSTKKQDRAIRHGFTLGGASDVEFSKPAGKGYRQCFLKIADKSYTVFNIPTSSNLDDVAMKRKARDIVRRFMRYRTRTLSW